MVAERTKILDPTTMINDGGFSAVGESTIWEAVAVGDPIVHSTGSYATRGSGGVEDEFRVRNDVLFTEKMAHVSSVTVYSQHEKASGGTESCDIGVRLGGVESLVTVNITTTAGITRDTGALARPGGGSWVEADFRDLTFNIMWNTTASPPSAEMHIISLYALVVYVPLNRTIDLEREIASRRLRLHREPEEVVTLVHGWEALAAELMDPVGYSHAHGPTYDGKGYGVKGWQRGFGRLKKQQISLSMPKVISTIGNRRRFQVTFWETMKLSVSGDPDIADGLVRLDACGADREFSRTSNAWSEDAGGVIRLATAGKERIGPKGILVEGARGNFLPEGSFVNGTTGWAKVENSGTADFATDTGDLLFEDTVSAQSVKLTITSAPYDIDINDKTTALAATTEYVFSLDWEQDNVATHKVAIQNDTSGEWLQGDGSWGASRVDISLGTAVDSRERDLLVLTTDVASIHTIFAQVVGSINGTVHHFYHVQIEIGGGDGFASSQIVTGGAVFTRLQDDLSIRNDSSLTQRIWPVDKFTAELIITPLWNSADLTDPKILLELNHGANDSIRLIHFGSGGGSVLHFEYVHGGTIERAGIPSPVGLTRNTEVRITMRKTSGAGELDITNNTINLFLGGVKGSVEDTVPVDLEEAASSFLQLGAEDDLTNPSFCYYGSLVVSPICYSDTEILGGPI